MIVCYRKTWTMNINSIVEHDKMLYTENKTEDGCIYFEANNNFFLWKLDS